jgi:hypothetical protein
MRIQGPLSEPAPTSSTSQAQTSTERYMRDIDVTSLPGKSRVEIRPKQWDLLFSMNSIACTEKRLNSLVSKCNILIFEGTIRKVVDHLCERIPDYRDANKTINLTNAYLAMTMDIATAYAFGRSSALLSQEKFSQKWRYHNHRNAKHCYNESLQMAPSAHGNAASIRYESYQCLSLKIQVRDNYLKNSLADLICAIEQSRNR